MNTPQHTNRDYLSRVGKIGDNSEETVYHELKPGYNASTLKCDLLNFIGAVPEQCKHLLWKQPSVNSQVENINLSFWC